MTPSIQAGTYSTVYSQIRTECDLVWCSCLDLENDLRVSGITARKYSHMKHKYSTWRSNNRAEGGHKVTVYDILTLMAKLA